MKAAWLVVFLVGCGPTYIDAVGLAPTTLGEGLVAHWTFDQTDGPTLEDDSGNRRIGTISGATFRSDGRFGSALQFRPGDSVTVENFPNAMSSAMSSWSFSAWLRIGNEDNANDGFATVISTELMQEGGWQLQTRDLSAGIYWTFAYWVGPGPNWAHHECVCFVPGRWSHATVVVDGQNNRLSFYVDGKLDKSDLLPAPIRPGSPSLYMGKWMGAGRLFSGSIDDVAIYSRALSPAEVTELDMRPPPPPR